MPVRGSFELKGLDAYLETIANAEKDVDQVVADVLNQARPEVEANVLDRLRQTSEEWTGETASTMRVTEAQRDGNYTFIGLSIGGAPAPQAFFKEFGTTRQTAEPFWRPALTELRRSKIKTMLKSVLERFGLPTIS